MSNEAEDGKQISAQHPRQATRVERAKLFWAAEPMPDSAYDPEKGWKLDQFAMHCEPRELQKYKESSYVHHYFPAMQRKLNVSEYVRMLAFPQLIGKRLLEFRVTGFRPGCNEAEQIPLPLLEVLHPIIELSELVDLFHEPPQRRYELVRVFHASGPEKSRGGRGPTYNWPKLVNELLQEGRTFETRAALIEYCRANVRAMPGKRRDPDGPHDNTIRPAILKYGLEKLIKPSAP
jgi:hypothetical protein